MEVDDATDESGASLEFDLNNIQKTKQNETVENPSIEQLEPGSSSGSNLPLIQQGRSKQNLTVSPLPSIELSDLAVAHSPNASQPKTYNSEDNEEGTSAIRIGSPMNQADFNPQPEISNLVGLGPRVHGPFHSEQDGHHQIYPNQPNSGVGSFSQIRDVSLSMNMGSANRYGTLTRLMHKVMNNNNLNSNTSHPPLFLQNSTGMATLNQRPLQTSREEASQLHGNQNNPHGKLMASPGSHQFPWQQLNQGHPFPHAHAPQYHYPIEPGQPMPFRPQQFLYHPYSNISEQTAGVTARAPQIPKQHQLHSRVQMTQNSWTLAPSMASTLRFPPAHLPYHHYQRQSSQALLSSTLPRRRRNDESHERSLNEVARSFVSCSSPNSSQQNHTHYHQTRQEQEMSKSSKEGVPDPPAAPISRHIRKRARNGTPKRFLFGESSSPSICVKSRIGSGWMRNRPSYNAPPFPLNSSEGRVKNSLYDIMFEEVGLPIDPHLRLFTPL